MWAGIPKWPFWVLFTVPWCFEGKIHRWQIAKRKLLGLFSSFHWPDTDSLPIRCWKLPNVHECTWPPKLCEFHTPIAFWSWVPYTTFHNSLIYCNCFNYLGLLKSTCEVEQGKFIEHPALGRTKFHEIPDRSETEKDLEGLGPPLYTNGIWFRLPSSSPWPFQFTVAEMRIFRGHLHDPATDIWMIITVIT